MVAQLTTDTVLDMVTQLTTDTVLDMVTQLTQCFTWSIAELLVMVAL